MKVLRFKEHQKGHELAEDFIEMLSNPIINEKLADDKSWKQILNKVFTDLGLHFELISTFGSGIAAMFPIVKELIANNKLNIDLNQESILLLTITAITIIYIEEKKSEVTNLDIEVDIEDIKEDAKSLLTELKLRGIGNGIVKKVVKSFTAISNLVKIVFKNLKYVIEGFVDMFSYTALLVPTMNVFLSFIDKYDLNLDSVIGNLLSVGVGVMTIIAKQGINFLIDKLGSKFNLKKSKIIKSLPDPESFVDVDIEQDNELIKGNENKKV